MWEVTAAIYRPDRSLPPGTIISPASRFDASNPLTILPGEQVFAFAAARVHVVVQDRDVEGLVLTVNPPDIQGRVIGFLG
jgi:hypothetical protein